MKIHSSIFVIMSEYIKKKYVIAHVSHAMFQPTVSALKKTDTVSQNIAWLTRAIAYFFLYIFTHDNRNWTVNLHMATKSGLVAIYRDTSSLLVAIDHWLHRYLVCCWAPPSYYLDMEDIWRWLGYKGWQQLPPKQSDALQWVAYV